jgi:hypothetical protein
MARAADFDLAAALAKPGFTPGRGDVPALLDLIAGGVDPGAQRAAVALAGLGELGLSAILARLETGGALDEGAPANTPPPGAQRAGSAGALDEGAPAKAPSPNARRDAPAAGVVDEGAPAKAPAPRVTRDAPAAVTLDEGARARLVGAVGIVARGQGVASEAARARLVAWSADAQVRVRRAAISALGKIGGEAARVALIARWDAGDAPPDEKRALAEALGKVGGDDALVRLRATDATGDSELARRRDRAVLMADRSSHRTEASEVAVDVPPPNGAPIVRLATKPGLAPLLVEELRSLRLDPRPRDDAHVDLDLRGPWSSLFGSRLWATAAVQLGRLPLAAGAIGDDPRTGRPTDSAGIIVRRASLRSAGAGDDPRTGRPTDSAGIIVRRASLRSAGVPAAPPGRNVRRVRGDDAIDRVADPDALGDAIVSLVIAPATRALLAAWTRGPIRWRLGFARGHKRSIVWRVARDVRAAAPELINDPSSTTWDIIVDDEAGSVELAPRRLADPRTSWRVADVPAASHPSVAAALAWVAAVRPDDRVWDPFCGSGLELAECFLRGARILAGTDLDDAALTAARSNLAAAGATAHLANGDARGFAPDELLGGAPTLIITNPPLGSRVAVAAPALLAEAVHNFGRRLAPRGRLVWITPATRRTSPAAEAIGLRLARSLPVDLGGVRGHLERWDR